MSVSANVFYQLIGKYHRTIGIFVATNLVILSMSGVILLFKPEVQHTKQQVNHSLNNHEFAVKYEQARKQLLSHYQNDKLLDIYPSETNPQIIQARLGINGANKVRGARVVNIDYQSGREVQKADEPYSQVYDWLLKLHHQLFLGPNGQIYIGIVGVAFILMNLTGLLMFLKRRMRKHSCQSRLIKYMYMHQYLGVFCICWGLVVGVSGSLLAFNPIFTHNFQKNILQSFAKKYHAEGKTLQADAPLEAVINTAFKAKPNGVIWYIVFPGMERGLPENYLVLIHGNGVLNQYISEYLIISAKTAELKEVIHLPLFMQLALIATPFHTLNQARFWVKLIWSGFAVTTLIFVFLGIGIFYMRKKIIYARKK